MTFELNRPALAELKKDQPLNTAEKKLIAGRKTGEMVVLGGSVPEDATPQNTIRAELIRFLLLGGCKDAHPHPKGVQVQGAWVSGVLDFKGCKSPLQLGVIASRFAETPVLDDCELGQLWLNGSHLPGLIALRMRVERNVVLGQGFRAGGLVNLTGSVIKGQLACENGSFDGKDGPALMAHGLDVGASVFLSGKFNAAGLVDLTGSAIKGQFNCEGGSFDGKGGPALMAHGLIVGGDVFLSGKFNAAGLVDLNGSVIKGQLSCNDGSFDGTGGPALMASGLDVGGDVFLSGKFNAAGLVNLTGSVIKGQLACVNGSFDGKGGPPLMAHGLDVGHSVFLRGEFNAAGLVDLNGAVINGQLDCKGGSFDGDLRLQGVQVTGPFFWWQVRGDVGWLDLTDAHVGVLVDDLASWRLARRYDIDGFRYGALKGALDLEGRLNWLDRAWNADILTYSLWPWHVPGSVPDTNPQHYTQLARIFDIVGNPTAAARVRREREVRLRRAIYYRARAAIPHTSLGPMLLAEIGRIFDFSFGRLFGYGYGYGFEARHVALWSALIVGFAANFFISPMPQGKWPRMHL